MPQYIEGLVAAPFTAMNDDCSLNLEIIEAQADFLYRNRVTGAFICGTTGEGLSLTIAERMQLMTRWIAVRPEGMTIIAHVGHNCITDAKALAKHAQETGLDAIGVTPPVFYKPATLEDLVAWCAEIASAAPQLAFYYYHIPSMTGVEVSMAAFLDAAKDRIPNLAGAKFTHHDLADYTACLADESRRFDMLFGRDEFLLAGLALGAKGAIGSTYNFAAPLYSRLIEAFERNDLATARMLQKKSVDMIELVAKTPCSFLPAAKSIMKMLGLDMGPVRLPLRKITADEYYGLKGQLERIGFFDYACK